MGLADTVKVKAVGNEIRWVYDVGVEFVVE